MATILLSSLSSDLFKAPAHDGGTVTREDIVGTGRILMAEAAGKKVNALRLAEKKPADYAFRLADGKYNEINDGLKKNMMMFCAKIVAEQNGENPPADYAEFQQNQRKYMGDAGFLRVLSGIIRDIVSPVLPACMSNGLSWLCETVTVPVGQTRTIEIGSNDIFVFEDSSRGARRSRAKNRLYSSEVTINPTMREATATWKWHQLIGNNADLGALFASMYAGLYNKVVALWNQAMVNAKNDASLFPAGMKFTTYSDSNLLKAVKAVQKANGGLKNVVGFGDIEALSKVLPTGNVNGASVNLDAALTEMLGGEYGRYGYVGERMGCRFMPIDNVVVPGTQNTTVSDLMDSNIIYFSAVGAHKPVYLGIEEGTPVTVTLMPSETDNASVDITVGVSMVAVPVFGSKLAMMQPV